MFVFVAPRDECGAGMLNRGFILAENQIFVKCDFFRYEFLRLFERFFCDKQREIRPGEPKTTRKTQTGHKGRKLRAIFLEK